MRTLALIDNDMYFRNFLKSGAFDELLKDKDFKISLAKQVLSIDKKIPKSKFTDRYIRSDQNKAVIFVYNQIALRALRKKSSTFDIKAKIYKVDLKNWLVYNFFSKPPVFPFTKKIILNKLKPNKSLEKLIKKEQPDLVIMPLTGTEATSYELILLSQKYHFKTLFLINGWDNLSSKATLLLHPDYIGVWGPQQLKDAVNIQGMKKENCFLLGCARYEDYFKRKDQDLKKIFNFPYIVYAGTQTAHDELTHLKLFDQILSNRKGNKIKVIYRPHPNREKRFGEDLFNESNFKNTILDPQVKDDYYGNKNKGLESALSQNFPELDYNTSLLKNALFIISPLSSLIIEAAIFDVPSLIPANDDDPNPMSPAKHLKWRHFEGADKIPGWYIGKDNKELEKLFLGLLIKKSNKTLSRAIKKYLYYDSRTYSSRLSAIVKDLQLF